VGENGFAQFLEDISSNVQLVAGNVQKLLTSTYPHSGRYTSHKDLHKIGAVRIQAISPFLNILQYGSVFTTIPHILQNVLRNKKEINNIRSHTM